MKVYFPDANTAFMLISENRNVSAKTALTNNKISNVEFSDNANKTIRRLSGNSKKERTDPSGIASDANFYEPNSEFGMAMKKNIQTFRIQDGDMGQYPFLKYYTQNLQEICRWKSGIETGRLYKVYQQFS
jgi:hypothetical protein